MLDGYEGRYARTTLTVHLDGAQLEAHTYAMALDAPRRPPGDRYLSVIAYGYGRLGFPLDPLLEAAGREVTPKR